MRSIIPEEYAVEYVVGRVETTASVWLGLTLGCPEVLDALAAAPW